MKLQRPRFGRKVVDAPDDLRLRHLGVMLTYSEYSTISQLAGAESLSSFARRMMFLGIGRAQEEQE